MVQRPPYGAKSEGHIRRHAFGFDRDGPVFLNLGYLIAGRQGLL
jgi:hypothetical protein